MPNPARQALFAQMAARLLHAAKAQNWAALEAADRALAEQLPRLAAQGAWSSTERAALQSLAQAHDAARKATATAGQALAERIALLRAGRDGWLAYALHSEHESESPTP